MKIKPELLEKFTQYTNLDPEAGNVQEGPMPRAYFQEIIDTAHAVGDALDAGKTPEEAIEMMNGRDLTGYMAGEAISIAAHFNPRGEELKAPWNKRCGGSGDEKGTINPAIITISAPQENK